MREQNIGERGRVIAQSCSKQSSSSERSAGNIAWLSSAQVNLLVALGRDAIVKLIVSVQAANGVKRRWSSGRAANHSPDHSGIIEIAYSALFQRASRYSSCRSRKRKWERLSVQLTPKPPIQAEGGFEGLGKQKLRRVVPEETNRGYVFRICLSSSRVKRW